MNVQKQLYRRSMDQPDYVFRKLWGFVTDPQNLRIALCRVARNRGRRTSGVDGITVRDILAEGIESFVATLRADLRSGAYRPNPVRRVLIPKPGHPGKFRPLGIPTVKDRVVQAALKNIMEPIFEADFYPISYGFRPGRSVHGALEQLTSFMCPQREDPTGKPRLPYQWAVEGDIKGCFDNIGHHGLMERLRLRVGDAKVNRLVLAFLNAGIMAQEQFLRTDGGTPQGGILSPLLANIALSVLDERYTRHTWPRRKPTLLTEPARILNRARKLRDMDKSSGKTVAVPVRYADDFIVLISVPPGPDQSDRAREAALAEKQAIAALLKENLGLELSEEKTLVTPVTQSLDFLGHRLGVRRYRRHGRAHCALVIPKSRTRRLRERVKDLFRRNTIGSSLDERLRLLNPMLRGWANFYRHANDAYRVFHGVDRYVWWTIFRWIQKKHDRPAMRALLHRYAVRRRGGSSIEWRDGATAPFRLSTVRTGSFRFAWQKPPRFADPSMESPVHNERCTPGSAGGARKPARR
ncbi:group II intron reverse transcriptase/maturase [Polyangium jinanense]|nr:group II intron reverse transcriptase/maturase [Polyangium jinanense]